MAMWAVCRCKPHFPLVFATVGPDPAQVRETPALRALGGMACLQQSQGVKGGEKVDHYGGGIVYHRHDER